MVTIDNNPWFVASDVCKVLTLQNPSVAVTPLDASEWSKANLGQRGLGSVIIISESGLYKLVMRSDKPEAKGFQDWVTKVVLPAIRKDGGYIMGEEKVVTGEMTEDDLLKNPLKYLEAIIGQAKELQARQAVVLSPTVTMNVSTPQKSERQCNHQRRR